MKKIKIKRLSPTTLALNHTRSIEDLRAFAEWMGTPEKLRKHKSLKAFAKTTAVGIEVLRWWKNKFQF